MFWRGFEAGPLLPDSSLSQGQAQAANWRPGIPDICGIVWGTITAPEAPCRCQRLPQRHWHVDTSGGPAQAAKRQLAPSVVLLDCLGF